MRVDLRDVTKGRNRRALPATSLTFETGSVTLACAETEQRPTVLGLIASGRMRPDSGSVLFDGRVDAGALRRSVALVDALDVSEPEPNITVAGVVAEELMFAGVPSDPFSTRKWIDAHGLSTLAGTPIATVAPAQRIRLLCELAVLRPGVSGFVLTSPDRHGGDPEAWWAIAQNFAARGFAVLVIAGRASEAVLRDQIAASDSVPEDEVVVRESLPDEQIAESAGRRIELESEDSAAILRPNDDPPTEHDDDDPDDNEQDTAEEGARS